MKDILFEFDGSNIQLARYTHGAGIDEPLIMELGGASSFYHADGLGSIVDLTDNVGAVAQSYVYDSFGNIVAQNGSLINPYTYTGREFDPESGLYFYRARFYDPSIGRFITEDPLGLVDDNNFYIYVDSVGKPLMFNPSDFTNAYNYTGNNPINFIDPFGLIKQLLRVGERVIIVDDTEQTRFAQKRYDPTTKLLFESTVDAYLTTTGAVFSGGALATGSSLLQVGSAAVGVASTTCSISGLKSGKSDLTDVLFDAGGTLRGISGVVFSTTNLIRKILGY